MHGLRFVFWLLRYLLDSSGSVWRFMLSMALFVFLFMYVYYCLSHRRVGGSYAPRVSPAVTRLTVYRWLQVSSNWRCPSSWGTFTSFRSICGGEDAWRCPCTCSLGSWDSPHCENDGFLIRLIIFDTTTRHTFCENSSSLRVRHHTHGSQPLP